MATEEARWTVSLSRDECLVRVRSAGSVYSSTAGMGAWFSGGKVVNVEVKGSAVKFSGRYGKSWGAKGFLTYLQANFVELAGGRTAVACSGHLVSPVIWLFRFWFSGITFAFCLMIGVYVFGPVKPPLDQLAGGLGGLCVMGLAGLGMRRLMGLAGSGEQAYLLTVLRASLEEPH